MTQKFILLSINNSCKGYDYYPYGKELRQFNNGLVERYKSTNHERDIETNYDNRGARLSDFETVRFLSPDPLEHKFPSLSTYNYVGGNPIIFIDPDGRALDDFYSNTSNTLLGVVRTAPNAPDNFYRVNDNRTVTGISVNQYQRGNSNIQRQGFFSLTPQQKVNVVANANEGSYENCKLSPDQCNAYNGFSQKSLSEFITSNQNTAPVSTPRNSGIVVGAGNNTTPIFFVWNVGEVNTSGCPVYTMKNTAQQTPATHPLITNVVLPTPGQGATVPFPVSIPGPFAPNLTQPVRNYDSGKVYDNKPATDANGNPVPQKK